MIDLADYTKPIRDQLKRGRFGCVYVAGMESPKACRIGYAEDLAPAVARLRRSATAAVTIESAFWAPDRRISSHHNRQGGSVRPGPPCKGRRMVRC
ncbi:hypothetical protein SAMN05216337_105030 [Bradyrhizobium brasilense]|uniref:Uncharacterized protein n=1 Tax=Bradyrhizobium brasilense TaxID=1419277 RepID=A0A1G7JVT6_9BRAD|nr:hypothetical protein SAMN05216337_105030 [Bradyrhizobium brasilense]